GDMVPQVLVRIAETTQKPCSGRTTEACKIDLKLPPIEGLGRRGGDARHERERGREGGRPVLRELLEVLDLEKDLSRSLRARLHELLEQNAARLAPALVMFVWRRRVEGQRIEQ